MAQTRPLSNAKVLRDASVLRRGRHLGSARDGPQEWRLQRRAALALIPVGLSFVASMLGLATSDQMTAATWLASPSAGVADQPLRARSARACGGRIA